MSVGPRLLAVTVVHRPQDARILHRQLRSLHTHGWDLTYAAPFTGHAQPAPDWLATIDVTRAVGTDRLAALRHARRVLRTEGPHHDLVLLHDPELLLALPGSGLRRVVWDVHEDLAASLVDRPWVPRLLRRGLGAAVHLVERWAERRCATLLLAEHAYRDRFRRDHPVVPNLPHVPADQPPPPGPDRVVYVGRLSASRGAHELVALARVLADDGVGVELVGQAEPDVAPALRAADADGSLRWHGFLPNDRALALVEGATAGLSLLHDEPNYRQSMPTKVVEYLARGLPVVTTPLPEAVRLVAPHDLGVVVPFGDVAATAAAVRGLVEDVDRRIATGRRAWHHARQHLDWSVAADRLDAVLREVAAG